MNGIINIPEGESDLTICLIVLLKVSFLRRERTLAPRRVREHNISTTNGNSELGADGAFAVLDVLLENGSGLSDGWMRTDISRILFEQAFLKDDTFHHVRRVRHAIFVDCFGKCIVTHTGVGDDRGW